MKVKLIFETDSVTFLADPEGDYEEKLLLALQQRGFLDAKVEYQTEHWQREKNVRCVIRQRRPEPPPTVTTTT